VRLSSGAAGYGRVVAVDHEAPRPVYLQVADILRAAIERGELAPDRAIPSEARLMQEHGIARETARKAVRVLADEGLVYVVQGRGVYVTQR
jgi:GntR family transcriptional regulator